LRPPAKAPAGPPGAASVFGSQFGHDFAEAAPLTLEAHITPPWPPGPTPPRNRRANTGLCARAGLCA